MVAMLAPEKRSRRYECCHACRQTLQYAAGAPRTATTCADDVLLRFDEGGLSSAPIEASLKHLPAAPIGEPRVAARADERKLALPLTLGAVALWAKRSVGSVM